MSFFSTYKLQTTSEESAPDNVQSCAFTDVEIETLLDFREGWGHRCGTCRRQKVTQRRPQYDITRTLYYGACMIKSG